MALRGFGDVSLGTRVADHKKRTDQRDAKHRAFMEEARDRPEDFSPVVPYKEVGDWMVGRKIEVRWWVGDSKTPDYLHCFEGTVLEIIPYSNSRPNYPEFRLCKHAVAKVQWDDVFKMHDSHVPLNPGLYADEKKHCGWNILSLDYVQYAQGTASIARALEFDGSMLFGKEHQEDANVECDESENF